MKQVQMFLYEDLFAFLEQYLLGVLVQIQPDAFLLLVKPLFDLFHVLGDRILSEKLGTLAIVIVFGARDERRLEMLLVNFERRFFAVLRLGLI